MSTYLEGGYPNSSFQTKDSLRHFATAQSAEDSTHNQNAWLEG